MQMLELFFYCIDGSLNYKFTGIVNSQRTSMSGSVDISNTLFSNFTATKTSSKSAGDNSVKKSAGETMHQCLLDLKYSELLKTH